MFELITHTKGDVMIEDGVAYLFSRKAINFLHALSDLPDTPIQELARLFSYKCNKNILFLGDVHYKTWLPRGGQPRWT
jgi:hypothetical protein